MTERERLIELLQEYTDDNNGGGSNYGCADHLIANGIIALPCKVGDKLYDDRLREYSVMSISVLVSSTVRGINIHTYNFRNEVTSFGLSDFGETVFLTREEAEKALKEMER